MLRNIDEATFTLVVCTQTYARRVAGEETPGVGVGATWEGAIITQALYEGQQHNTRFIPVVVSPDDVAFIPIFLRGNTYYDVSTDEGYDRLYRHLTGQPEVVPPPLGQLRIRPPITDGGAGVVGQTGPSQAHVASVKSSDLALVMVGDGAWVIAEALRVAVGDNVRLELIPGDGREAAFFADLRNRRHEVVAVAHGLNAHLGQVERVEQVRQAGNDAWEITLGVQQSVRPAEFAYGNFSADDLAELRARRILLNEAAPEPASRFDIVGSQLLEAIVQGIRTPIAAKGSPFPALYRLLSNDIPLLLKACQLHGVLWLQLSGVVEHVLRLDVSMPEAGRLDVDFEGQRARQYTNIPPHVIRVQGSCRLICEEVT
jgi:hypothetical protein